MPHGAVRVRGQTITGREIRGRWLRMKGVIVQRIDNVHNTIGRIYTDCRTVDRIWYRSIESPVPVWDPKGGGRGLVLASPGCWVRCCDLRGVLPDNLLSASVVELRV